MLFETSFLLEPSLLLETSLCCLRRVFSRDEFMLHGRVYVAREDVKYNICPVHGNEAVNLPQNTRLLSD